MGADMTMHPDINRLAHPERLQGLTYLRRARGAWRRKFWAGVKYVVSVALVFAALYSITAYPGFFQL